jgi:hypothetical protein
VPQRRAFSYDASGRNPLKTTPKSFLVTRDEAPQVGSSDSAVVDTCNGVIQGFNFHAILTARDVFVTLGGNLFTEIAHWLIASLEIVFTNHIGSGLGRQEIRCGR